MGSQLAARNLRFRVAVAEQMQMLDRVQKTGGWTDHLGTSDGREVERRVDAILLTGGLAWSEYLPQNLTERVEFIAPVHVIPGEIEMEALSQSALSVLRKETVAKNYTGQPVFAGFEAWKTEQDKDG